MLTAVWRLWLAVCRRQCQGGTSQHSQVAAQHACLPSTTFALPPTRTPPVVLPPQALAKVAVRSGEPYRLQCYSILAAAAGAGSAGDALGLGPAVRPALALLDRLYAAQVRVAAGRLGWCWVAAATPCLLKATMGGPGLFCSPPPPNMPFLALPTACAGPAACGARRGRRRLAQAGDCLAGAAQCRADATGGHAAVEEAAREAAGWWWLAGQLACLPAFSVRCGMHLGTSPCVRRQRCMCWPR